jgi:hypothetical protein
LSKRGEAESWPDAVSDEIRDGEVLTLSGFADLPQLGIGEADVELRSFDAMSLAIV